MNRPCPPDFLEQFELHNGSLRGLQLHYSAGAVTMARWARQQGVTKVTKGRTFRPMPDDFPALAADHNDRWLRTHFGAGDMTVVRWREEARVAAPTIVHPRAARPAPAEFKRVCPTMTLTGLVKHFGATDTTIRRWAREENVRPKPGQYVRGLKAAPISPIDDSLLGLAKQHLRSFYPNVHNAEILPLAERKRLPNKGKDLVVVGGKGALPPAEVIALAKSRGFYPQALGRF